MGQGSAAAVAATACPSVDTLRFLDAAVPSGLPPADLVDAVIACERLVAHVHGVQTRLLAELGRPGRCGDITALVDALVDKAGLGRNAAGEIDAAEVEQVTADTAVRAAAAEVAAVLDWSPVTAKIRIQQSQRLVSALPATLTALEHGRVDVGRARMICDRTAVLSPEVCHTVEARILPWVKGRSKAALENLVDREVVIADPAAAENRRIKARTDRSVSHRPDKDGIGVITALLPAEAAVMLFTLIDLIAQANKGLDDRTVDQRRADALADIADELLTHGYVDLDRLIACINDNKTTTTTPDRPGTPTPDPTPADHRPGRRRAPLPTTPAADTGVGAAEPAGPAHADSNDPDADLDAGVPAAGPVDQPRAGRPPTPRRRP